MLRGIRGAISIKENKKEEIEDKMEQLLNQIIEENQLKPDDIASIFISVTDDINAGFPAAALRRFKGFTYVPVMCMREIAVPGSLPLIIRTMLHVNTHKNQEEIIHVYLGEATKLRPDLSVK